jgi:hypothetical protein
MVCKRGDIGRAVRQGWKMPACDRRLRAALVSVVAPCADPKRYISNLPVLATWETRLLGGQQMSDFFTKLYYFNKEESEVPGGTGL